jgi:hypothetical protein
MFFYGYSPVMNGFITFIWSVVALHTYDRREDQKYLFAFFALTALHFLDMSYHHSVAFSVYIFFDRLVYGRHSRGFKQGVLLPYLAGLLGFAAASVNWIPQVRALLLTVRIGLKYNDTFLFAPLQFLTGTLWGWAKGTAPYPPLYLYLNCILIILFVPNVLRKYRNGRDLTFYGLVTGVVLLHLLPGYPLGFMFPSLTGYDPFRLNVLLSIVLSVNAAKLTQKMLSEPESSRVLCIVMMGCIVVATVLGKVLG